MADKKVMKNDTVTVYGTGNSPHIAKGAKKTMHKIPAEKLYAAGAVSYDKVEPDAPAAATGKKGKGKTE